MRLPPAHSQVWSCPYSLRSVWFLSTYKQQTAKVSLEHQTQRATCASKAQVAPTITVVSASSSGCPRVACGSSSMTHELPDRPAPHYLPPYHSTCRCSPLTQYENCALVSTRKAYSLPCFTLKENSSRSVSVALTERMSATCGHKRALAGESEDVRAPCGLTHAHLDRLHLALAALVSDLAVGHAEVPFLVHGCEHLGALLPHYALQRRRRSCCLRRCTNCCTADLDRALCWPVDGRHAHHRRSRCAAASRDVQRPLGAAKHAAWRQRWRCAQLRFDEFSFAPFESLEYYIAGKRLESTASI